MSAIDEPDYDELVEEIIVSPTERNVYFIPDQTIEARTYDALQSVPSGGTEELVSTEQGRSNANSISRGYITVNKFRLLIGILLIVVACFLALAVVLIMQQFGSDPDANQTRVDGGWSDWSSWDTCSVTCGIGMQDRERSCSSPYPSAAGKYCYGDATAYRICFKAACQDHYVGFSVSEPMILDAKNITFTRVYANVGNRYDNATGTFTCNSPGYYFFSLAVRKTSLTRSLDCHIRKEGQVIGYVHINPQADGMFFSSASTTAYTHLSLGEGVTTTCNNPSDIYTKCCSSFTGYMAHAD